MINMYTKFEVSCLSGSTDILGKLKISANYTFFASSHGWCTMSEYWSKSLSANFRGNGVSPINDSWHQKSCGIVCVILRLAVLTQYRCVTDGQTGGGG